MSVPNDAPHSDVTKVLVDLEAAHAAVLDPNTPTPQFDRALVDQHMAIPCLVAAVRAGLALANELDGERDGYGYAIRNGLKPGPGDRIRAAITTALAGQHATDEEER